MEKLEFTRVRDVKCPNRANQGDAGLDFYVPKLTWEELVGVGSSEGKTGINHTMWTNGYIKLHYGDETTVDGIILKPHGRVLIPSGIKVLINPRESMLMAANKSGVATKEGLTYTAEIVDSPYTGEMHIGIYNGSPFDVLIPLKEDKKIMQFIHVPIILTEPTEISEAEYNDKAKDWGTRGEKGFGAHDNI